MARAVPVIALSVAIAAGVLTDCTSTVQGTAIKTRSSVPADDVPQLKESALDGLLLSDRALSKIADVELESFYSSEELNDNADLVSRADCLGAVYPGEITVYDGAHWSSVRDELFLEAGGDDDAKLVEQTLVLFDTDDEAVEFFESSKNSWQNCAQMKHIEVEDGAWRPAAVKDVDERTMSLKARISGSIEGTCQHAMGVISNLIVEGFACDTDDRDDAQQITSQILEDAAQQ